MLMGVGLFGFCTTETWPRTSVGKSGQYAGARRASSRAVGDAGRSGEGAQSLGGRGASRFRARSITARASKPNRDVVHGRLKGVFHAGLRRKVGVFTEEHEDLELIQALLSAMAQNGSRRRSSVLWT
jgi:hypothetical protein